MTNWHQNTLIAFDTETTGVDVETDRIVTAAVIVIDPMSGTVDTAQWLANPGVDIPAEATKVHGITTDMARADGRPPAEVVTEITARLQAAWDAGHPVVAYNAAYDISLLDRECRRHTGQPLTVGRLIDPFVIDKHLDTYRPGKRTLIATAKHYGIDLSELDAHGAAADALAAARVAWKIAHTHPELAAMPLDELHTRQVAWYAAQADSFAAYLRRRKLREEGPAAAEAVKVDRDWPLRPLPEPEAMAS